MAYTIKVKRQADTDAEQAMEWYDEQKLGLGGAFLIEFLEFCDKISRHPTHFSQKYAPYRKASMKKFPYDIHFAIDNRKQEIIILAVWHIKRDTEKLMKG